jgi:glycosyltransferase involved in cell wall biosynthesis
MNLLLFNFKTDAKCDLLGVTTDWINAFAPHFENVYVITSEKGDLKLADNVKVYSLGVEKGNGLFKKLIRFWRLMKSVRKGEFGLVFYHMTYHFAVLSWPFLRKKKAPRVMWYAHKSRPFGLRLAAPLLDRICTTSEVGCTVAPKKREILGHGISEDKFSYVPRKSHGKFEILSVSRLSPIKRLEQIIEAVSLVAHEKGHGSIKLTIVGDAPLKEHKKYRQQLEARVEELGLSKVVKFVGAVPYDEVQRFYEEADLMVNVSDTGSVDKAVLEAFMTGLPVLALEKGYGEVFEGMPSGKKCALSNAEPEHVAEKIEKFMELSYLQRSELGKFWSDSVAVRYGLKNFVKKVLKIRDNLVS